MSIPLTPQYDPKSLYTDGCTSPQCTATLNAASSLSQGKEFLEMNKNLHGGRRASRRSASRRSASRRASKRASRRAHRRAHRKSTTRRQSGGAADYPGSLSALLPTDLRGPADVAYTFNSFAQLPAFVGKYGGVGGGKRTRRAQRGGAEGFGYTPGPTNVPNYMILSPQDEPKAFLNPQWYTENEVVPSFQGPTNAFAQQSYNNQFNYAQRAGSRRHRKGRKGSRKGRKGHKGRKH